MYNWLLVNWLRDAIECYDVLFICNVVRQGIASKENSTNDKDMSGDNSHGIEMDDMPATAMKSKKDLPVSDRSFCLLTLEMY